MTSPCAKQPFHGVRANGLNPADESKMFGRDGILAHTYMLGPNGQSNGCVSFSNYNAFLTAYLNGEVTRLVVVDHLAKKTSPILSQRLNGLPTPSKTSWGDPELLAGSGEVPVIPCFDPVDIACEVEVSLGPLRGVSRSHERGIT